jgi:hypothetical protein
MNYAMPKHTDEVEEKAGQEARMSNDKKCLVFTDDVLDSDYPFPEIEIE